MEMGLLIARAYGVAGLVCQHVADVPYGYEIRRLSREDLATMTRQHVQQAYDTFMQRFDLDGVPLTSLITLEADVAQALQETVMTQGVDLIVMGARGHSTAAALLLGSLTEKLIWMTTVPLLVVKDKGERVGFLKIYSIARDAVVL